MSYRMKSTDQLKRGHIHMWHPIYCENGCGAVIELTGAFESYRRGEDSKRLLICECCAAEEGHVHEDQETPRTAPVCRRPVKKHIHKGKKQ